jgi:hypothetical protein
MVLNGALVFKSPLSRERGGEAVFAASRAGAARKLTLLESEQGFATLNL